MPELQRLNAGHAPAVLAFELANRAYFAASISDRGDEFFDQFAERYSALLADQETGSCAYYLLVGEDGSVLGRFNLVGMADGTAELGYRVAEHAAGRGVATAAVRELCRLAAAQHGLRTLRARVTPDNAASQKVLAKAGFRPAGPADINGRPATWYERDLAAGCPEPRGRPGLQAGLGYRREVSSVTMSAADCVCLARATPCPAHIESASISPVVPAIGGAGS